MGFLAPSAPDTSKQEELQRKQEELAAQQRAKVRRKEALEAQAEGARKRALLSQGQGGNTLTGSFLGVSANEKLGGF